MPEGFSPSAELEYVYNVRDMIQGSRQLVPLALEKLRLRLNDDKRPQVQLQAINETFNRAYGTPRQQISLVVASDGPNETKAPRVLELPSNNRSNLPNGPLIDA